LLVFDTSSAMKKCLPVTGSAVNQLFLSSLSTQLQPGDTIGIWTFGTDVSAGRFPLQVWKPEAAAMIASNINVFVGHQRYASSTKFGPLMQLVNNVAQDSERLTVLIFCDGDDQFQGTPYDAAVNALFRQNQRATQQAKQPFVVVLRSQLGQYTGCQISSPPSPISFPDFPPLPLPPAPTAPANVPPPASAAQVPSLIIIGTHVGTNLPPPEPKPAPIEPKPAPTNLPTEQTTTSVVLVTMVTNIVVPTNPVVQTNATVSPPENSDAGGKKPMVIGAVLLVAAGLLTAVVAFRMRRSDHGSLITRSMNRKK
jgi:hypothetical protein